MKLEYLIIGTVLGLTGCSHPFIEENINDSKFREELIKNYKEYEFERCSGLYGIKINYPTKYQEIIKKLEKEDNARK